MRRILLTLTLATSLLFSTRSAEAEPFIPRMNEPQSYKDFQYGLSEVRQNIESVQCGGFDTNTAASVNGTRVNGFIPTPNIFVKNPDGVVDPIALPGRQNLDPLGVATTGLGVRGDFEFPDTAIGYSSACYLYDDFITDPDLKRMKKKIVFNKDAGIDEDPNVRVVDDVNDGTEGRIDINPGHWCTRDRDMEKATPRWCKKLYDVWQQMAAIGPPRENRDDLCKCDKALNGCPFRPEKRYCFDTPYTFVCTGSSEKKDPVVSRDTDSPPQQETCRTPWLTHFNNKMTECHQEDVYDADGNRLGFNAVVDVGGDHFVQASSFYRHYAENFGDPAITVEAADKTWNVRAECYEYYQENDPRDIVTSKDAERCEFVIATPEERRPDTPEWPDQPSDNRAQKLPVEKIGENPVVGPPYNKVQEPDRQPRDVPEPWVVDPSTNLSMLDIKKLQDVQKDFDDPTDISGILGSLLPTKQRASKTVEKNARTDMFDDTDHRAFSAYWEAQQKELLTMIADPQTRLILPARFLVGIDDDDPLFQYVTHKIVRPDGIVELTLRAGPEDLRSVILSMQRMFIAPLQEVEIPVLVPLASDLEINTLLFQWQQWKQYELAKNLPDQAALADPLINKLTEYQTRIAEVRRMRGALANELTTLYDGQKKIREYFASWFTDESDQFTLTLAHAEQRRELRRVWRLLQNSLLQTDACQLLWCSNQRYSVPVYSLLDAWWGDQPSGEARNKGYELGSDSRFDPPLDLRDLGYKRPDDQVFDFSSMNFPRGPLLVPVLSPVQVKIRLPSPPIIGVDPPSVDTFPTLPDLPDENVFDSFLPPDVTIDEAPVVTLPPTPDLEEAITILRKIRIIVDGTDIDRQIEQENALKNSGSMEDIQIPRRGELLNPDSMLGAYCRFPQSILIPPDSTDLTHISDSIEVDHSDTDDAKGNPARIIHVENELRERLARLFSRWQPNRMEDYAGRTGRLGQDFPDPRNPPECHEGILCIFLPAETTEKTSWQWFMPTLSNDFINSIADTVRRSLPDVPVADRNTAEQNKYNPYENVTYATLERMFPALTLPIRIKLVPDPPSP